MPASRWAAWRTLVVTVALAIVAAGCSSPFPQLKPAATGQMAVMALVPETLVAQAAAHEVEVSLTQDRHQIHERRPLNGETFSLTLDNVYVGRWQVNVAIRDAEGDTIYAGSGSVWVSENETTTVQVPLTPQPGALKLTIDIGGLPLEQEAFKARLHLSPGDTHNLDRVEGTALFEANVAVQPGSYDFKVDFYTDSFHAHKIIYSGYWMPLSVTPGKTVTLYWRPGTGAVVIDAGPDGPPPAPAALSAQWTDDGVLLEWPGVPADNITAYRVYRRVGLLARYELVAEVDAATTSVLDTPPVLEEEPLTGPGLYYVVTALNGAGYESLRSPEAVVFAP